MQRKPLIRLRRSISLLLAVVMTFSFFAVPQAQAVTTGHATSEYLYGPDKDTTNNVFSGRGGFYVDRAGYMDVTLCLQQYANGNWWSRKCKVLNDEYFAQYWYEYRVQIDCSGWITSPWRVMMKAWDPSRTNQFFKIVSPAKTFDDNGCN